MTVSPVETLHEGLVTVQALGRLTVETRGQGFHEITREVAAWTSAQAVASGLLTVYCRHTSASLAIQENADPDVQADLLTALDRLAPRNAGYVHSAEGPDDMPGHIRAVLTGTQVAVPVVGGRLGLGTWQGIYLVEHRDRPHRRQVLVHVAGS